MSHHRTAVTPDRRVSTWAPGLVIFAGAMMVIVGVFHAITGLAALLDDKFYVVSANYVFEADITAWGWIHLLLGVIVLVAGWGVFTATPWARAVGMVLAICSAIANFFFIPYYPVWSIVIIGLDVAVIWALTVWDRDAVRELRA